MQRPYQIVECVIFQLSGLHAQIPESFGFGVDSLVNELPLYLVRRSRLPPNELIEIFGNGFQHCLRQVDVPPVFVNLFVYEFSDFCH